jgi:hypothetical protein
MSDANDIGVDVDERGMDEAENLGPSRLELHGNAGAALLK